MSSNGFVVAIPARLSASRLPGKPLRLLAGEPLIRHVARRALAAGADEVAIAADDPSIIDATRDLPVRAFLTSRDHTSGTDRLAECARLAGWSDDTLIVNLQGDEPFAPAEGIRAVAALLMTADPAEMATLSTPIESADDILNPNVVKIVADVHWRALYFSRAPIPWSRENFPANVAAVAARQWQRHIGIYAYRNRFLQQFALMPASSLELVESLEQLRVIEAGFRIKVGQTPVHFPHGVDTPEDLVQAELIAASSGQ